MRHATRKLLPTASLLALLGIAPGATAQEILSNGKLDADLTGWTSCCSSTGTLAFNPGGDASGSSLSGAARIEHVQSSVDETSMFMVRCLPGVGSLAGKAFFFGAKVRFGEGEVAAGRAFMSVEFRPDGNCAQGSTGGAFDDVDSDDLPRGTWVPLRIGKTSQGVVVPQGTNSLRIYVVLTKAALTATKLTIDVDDVFAAPAGTPVCDGMPATIIGTSDYDFINGTEGSDVIVGRGGIDWIDGKEGNDRICGGPGNDALYGGVGDDRLFGEGGQDNLQGAGDDDLLSGGGNNDTLDGGAGNDKLRGGTGIDTCKSSPGTDVKKKCELP